MITNQIFKSNKLCYTTTMEMKQDKPCMVSYKINHAVIHYLLTTISSQETFILRKAS